MSKLDPPTPKDLDSLLIQQAVGLLRLSVDSLVVISLITLLGLYVVAWCMLSTFSVITTTVAGIVLIAGLQSRSIMGEAGSSANSEEQEWQNYLKLADTVQEPAGPAKKTMNTLNG